MMDIFKAVIMRVNGTSPGPAPSITYDLDVNMPGRGAPLRLERITPSNHRRDTEPNGPNNCEIIAAKVNTIVDVAIIAGEFHATIYEPDALVTCGNAGGGALNRPPVMPGLLDGVIIPPPPPGGGAGPENTPSPGGDQ